MVSTDPFAQVMSLPGVRAAVDAAVAEINRVHRRPQALRRPEEISSTSLLRGAVTIAKQAGVQAEDMVHVYVAAAPELIDATVRTFTHSPLQVLADLDVRAGGDAIPVRHPDRLAALGKLAAIQPRSVDGDRLLPLMVAAEISAFDIFGPRSAAVAAVASRITAVATGLDPRGIVVPELYGVRYAARHDQAQAAWRGGDLAPLLIFLAEAWGAGATEADGIIASL